MTEFTRGQVRDRVERALAVGEAWFARLVLPARWVALAGGTAGGAVGLAMVRSMWRHAIFTGPHQNLTAGAGLLALWLCIGVVAGLAVLAPFPAADDASQFGTTADTAALPPLL